jgi:hypothetical protein
LLVHHAVVVEVETYATGEEALDACLPEAAGVCLEEMSALLVTWFRVICSIAVGGGITASQGKRNRFKNLRNCT